MEALWGGYDNRPLLFAPSTLAAPDLTPIAHGASPSSCMHVCLSKVPTCSIPAGNIPQRPRQNPRQYGRLHFDSNDVSVLLESDKRAFPSIVILSASRLYLATPCLRTSSSDVGRESRDERRSPFDAEEEEGEW